MEERFAAAQKLFAAKKYHDAVSAYAAIVGDDAAAAGDKVRGFNNISACYAALGDYDKALASAEAALELEPASARAHARLAAAREGKREYAEALPLWRRALELDAGSTAAAAAVKRVAALVAAGEGVASAAARDAFHYKRSLAEAQEAMKAGTYTEAVRLYTKAIDLCPPETSARELATLYANRSAANFRMPRYDESAADAATAAERDPSYARAHFRLATAEHARRRTDAAYEALRRCLELDPAHAEAAKLMEEVAPAALAARRTAAERRRDEEAKALAMRDRCNAERAAAAAAQEAQDTAYAGAHLLTSNYVYCTYCNETGHTRRECPVAPRKRDRPPR